MARARNIKPGFFLNDDLARCAPLARLLFAGLWCIADREGRLEDRPPRIKAETLPYDNIDTDVLLTELQTHNFITRYSADGRNYIQVNNFWKHQTPHIREPASTVPAPVGYLPNTGEPGKGKGQSGKGNQESGKGSARQVQASDVTLPASLDTPEVRQALADWLAYKSKRGEAYRDPAFVCRKLVEFESAGPAAFVAAVNSSIGSNYAGLFPAKGSSNGTNASRVGPGQRYRGPAS